MLAAVRLAAAQGIDVNSANGEGNTALHGAARAGHDSVVRFLVAHGARVDAANAVGQTPLSLARRGRGRTPNHSTVELLRQLGAGE